MDISQSSIGELIIEGKTKQVFQLNDDLVFILSKDRITAGDGLKSHEMVGKAALSTRTNCSVFEFLNAVGIRTHFVSRVVGVADAERAFVAKRCAMVPIEWVSRRVATGSYLKRNAHVSEGFRFAPPLLETFFKDDANHDPFWSIPTIIGARLVVGGLLIGEHHVQQMLALTRLVFEVLERCWHSLSHSLVDMKIEFGVVSDADGGHSIVVADIIDNDSWRLWPFGDKRLMLDKQVYRNLEPHQIDASAIAMVRSKFEEVADKTSRLFDALVPSLAPSAPAVAILLGSLVDREHALRIESTLAQKYGIGGVQTHVCSAHKSTEFALQVLDKIQQYNSTKVIIACAGRSNGLGPVLAGNTAIPVLNCPPTADVASLQTDIWSSLRLPTALGAATVIGPENAALSAAHIVANESPFVWSRIRAQQTYTLIKMLVDDRSLSDL